MNATPDRPAIHAVVRIVPSCIQFQRGPSSSVYSRQPRNAAIRAMPSQSPVLSSARLGWSIFTSIGTTNVTNSPGARLMKNSQCQE